MTADGILEHVRALPHRERVVHDAERRRTLPIRAGRRRLSSTE